MDLNTLPKCVIFNIKLRPYLRKHATHQCTSNQIRVDGRSEIGSYILTNAKTAPSGWRPTRLKREEKFTLKVPEHYFTDAGKGTYLSEAHKEHIADLFEISFWRDLYDFVMERRLKFGEKELVSIRKFREIYRISEDDYLEESMYKRFRRIKEKRVKPDRRMID